MNQKKCASLYCDQHIRKMILETAQLLSFAHHRFPNGARENKIYKYSKGHGNHPCAKWVYESQENYNWLVNLGWALIVEYKFRFGKDHATATVMGYLKRKMPALPQVPMTPFALVMPEEYWHIEKVSKPNVIYNPVKSYRKYYAAEKQEFKRGPALYTKRKNFTLRKKSLQHM